jgi:hypothetical protein
MTTFFEASKMSTDQASGQPLSDNQRKLIDLMVPVVQKYYGSKHLSEDDAKEAITPNIKDIQAVMGTILGNIIDSENKKMNDAIDAAEKDQTSYGSPY